MASHCNAQTLKQSVLMIHSGKKKSKKERGSTVKYTKTKNKSHIKVKVVK